MRVARLAAEQWGVLSIAELEACGLNREAVFVRVRNGRLHRLHRGVYAVGHASPPLQGRFLAAVKACGPGAVLSHLSAATLHGLHRWDHRHPEVTVPGGPRRRPGIRAHRSVVLEATDVSRLAGIPVTTPARTLADLAAPLPVAALRRMVREAHSLRLVQTHELLGLLDRLGRRAGAGKLAAVIAQGPAPTRSELEDVVLSLVLDGGLAPPDVNVPLTLGGRRIVPDFRWPSARLVVEADGAAWHDHRLAREDDAERQALLEAHGERVVRVTWAQAVRQPAQTLERIRAAGAPPATRSCSSSGSA